MNVRKTSAPNRVVVGISFLFLSFQAVSAQTASDFDAAAVFSRSCAPCHGPTGEGDGPVAPALVDKLPPLSGLAARNNGEFPREYVYKIIDGREQRRAHGSRVMPIWGSLYGLRYQTEGSSDTPTEVATKQKIDALVDYVEALQAQPQ